MKTRPDFRRRPLIEELEPRILFSADLAPAVLDGSPMAGEQRLLGADGEFSTQASDQESVQQTRLELVFIDPMVDNTRQFLDDILKQDDGRTIEVFLLDGERDGIAQIGDILAQRQDIDALHIISHGSDGSIQLGATTLDLDTLLQRSAQLGAWGDALGAEADILLYGCDVAAGTDGEAFIGQLALLTGADVASSTDLTGSAVLGGDWLLEYHDGTIETALALDAAAHGWVGTLAAPTLDLDGNDSAGAVGNGFATQVPVAGGAIAVTDIDAKLADSDSTHLSALTVSIVNLLDGANESLAAVTTGTSITASYDSGSGVLTLSGTDTVGHYQQVLRTITYEDTSTAPDRTARTLAFQADDGGATSNVATATVNWNYVRDDFSPSAYTGNDGSTNWNGNWTEVNDDGSVSGGRVTVSGGVLNRDLLSLVFPESTMRGVARAVDLSGATHAQLNFDHRVTSLDLLGNTTIQVDVSSDGGSNWTTVFTTGGSSAWTTESIDISAFASADTQIRLLSNSSAVLLNLGGVQFDNVEIASDAYSAAPSLDLDLNDSSGATGADFAAAFTEGGGAVTVADSDAVLSDIDSTLLEELVVTLTNPLDGASEFLSANVAATSIAASYDSSTATLTLSGTDTLANYQQVLRTISYNNSSENPDTSSRLLTFTASDGTGHSNVAMATVSVSAVNDAPANSVPAAQGTDEDTLLVFSAANGNAISVTDVDAGGSPLEVTLTATNGVLTLSGTTGLSFAGGDGSADASMTFSGSLADINAALDGMSFTPDANFSGAGSVQITTSDLGNSGSGGALVDSDSVAVTVVPVNDAPAITSNGGGAAASVSVAENTTAVTTVTAADVDVPADTLTYSIVGGADQARFAIDAATGVLSFAAAPDFEAPADANADNVYAVTVQVADGNGGFDTQALSVTVTNVNEAPSAADDSASGNEDTAISGNVLANDGDLENDVLTATLVAGPTSGSLLLNPDGSFSYTPNADFNGSDSFTYVASDGSLNSTVATVTLTVNPVNDAPTAANASINAVEDTVYAGTLPAAFDVEGDAVSYALGSTAAASGTATVNGDGSFSYAPNANFNGSDSFTYTVDDGNGGSNAYLVTVSVAAVNDAPVAAGDSASGLQGSVISGNVLANDSDVDGDALTATLVVGPAHGSVVLNPDGSYRYTPHTNFSGSDSFAYRASDGSLSSDVVTVTLTMHPVGSLPPDSPPPPPEPHGDSVTLPIVPLHPSPIFPATPGNQPPVAVAPLADLAENTAIQVTLHGYETAAPRLGNQFSSDDGFLHPKQLNVQLAQLPDIVLVEHDAGSAPRHLVSSAVNIELPKDKGLKMVLYAEEAKISALFLTAGTVWWGLRARGLMASLLASLPAWRSLDVLPVVRDKEEDREPPAGEDDTRLARRGSPDGSLDETDG